MMAVEISQMPAIIPTVLRLENTFGYDLGMAMSTHLILEREINISRYAEMS